ncbi:IS1634 family transposase [Euhalothece natronophila Z-M001]|uniref:IS1634 family transposase n=1 Tax=Euhalothece natronophila Z-M001 TaxID=522448 RepID=A0A5B8NMN6_9CHRO|nr:IS1634 family transposase [Euhalothece natronophila]QDZ40324.1 IS1634 family transposase [Euhalothece natronophila Z-M001]QDZ40439.1 IS1634 family transposase [Euhalothece natronophila Z-M001]
MATISNNFSSIEVTNLDHLGIVAGLIDEIGLVEQINELVVEQPREKVSPGHAVKAMILNGLGLFSSPLYLFPKFFEGKPTSHLIGEGIEAKHLNDDRLGRVLDKLYLTGLEDIFLSIALKAIKQFSIDVESVHLDSSSFSVEGEYENPLIEEVNLEVDSEPGEKRNPPQRIEITYGYSRDKRPDLKQFMVDLISSSDGDIPVFLRAGSGNESDQKVFPELFKQFRSQVDFDSLMVADRALYTAENLKQMEELKWLTRVPFRLKPAQALARQIKSSQMSSSSLDGYSYSIHQTTYGGIEQRWLVVESEERKESDQKRLEKKIKKDRLEAEKELRELSRQTYACVPDAIKAAKKLEKKFKYHQISQIETREEKDKNPDQAKVRVRAGLEENLALIQEEKQLAGRFLLATNIVDEGELSPNQMLIEYKEQQSTERGFRFLKDPMFLADSIFIKSPERIQAMVLILGLCLLIYNLGQRELRSALVRRGEMVKNQLGKETNSPTLRWIFQQFQAVHLLKVRGENEVSNLTEERLNLLELFPKPCQQYY